MTTEPGSKAAPPRPKPSVRERHHALRELDEMLERPMIYLGIVWAVLIIVQLTRGLSPLLATLSTIIWIVFIVDFVVRMVLAPYKVAYLRHNWLTALSLLLPALRVLRVLRVARLVRLASLGREASLVRIVSSLNRGMAALGGLLGRRGFGYVAALTVLVTLGGAAGMYAFEHDVPGTGITGYWTAVWWTAMVMTTMGSDYFPHTMQGRVLCVLLSLYAFTVFGYVTATLATFFVDREAASPHSDIPDQKTIEALQRDVAGLRNEIRTLIAASGGGAGAEAAQPAG